MNMIKETLGLLLTTSFSVIFPYIRRSVESVVENIEDKIIEMKTRLVREILFLLLVLIGGVFLLFALLFYFVEFLMWSKAISFFFIGIILIVAGLVFKVRILTMQKDKR